MVKIIVISLTSFTVALRKQKTAVSREDTLLTLGTGKVRDLFWDFLEERSKWWIGQNLMLLGKHQEEKQPR